MDDNQMAGGARSATAAHSKDGQPSQSGKNGGGYSEAIGGLADQAREGVQRARDSVASAAHDARDRVSEQGGQAIDSAVGYIREQPFMALAVTGAVCFVLGILLGRR